VYDDALRRGLELSGEDADYFAAERARWLAGRLERLGHVPRRVLDFGCGAGGAMPHLVGIPGVESVTGVDVSQALLDEAARRHASSRTSFVHTSRFDAAGAMDLAHTNGVFHHIAPGERAEALAFVRRSLRAGGLFSFWENNPWNPGTRWVMSRIPFDRDAIMLSAAEARRLLRAGGFDVVATDYLFIFPRALRWLRPLEPFLASLPLGAQYHILCRRS
jgi:SAM-dependent methyltransferase